MPAAAIGDVYFRFWSAQRQVSNMACPTLLTPHFRFALQYLALRNQLPEGTGYGRYTRWEGYCFGRQLHDVNQFAANISGWERAFDLNRFPLQVAVFQAGYYITDGAHRAAYAAAKIFRGELRSPVPIAIGPPANWPPIRGFTTIEQGAPQYLRF